MKVVQIRRIVSPQALVRALLHDVQYAVMLAGCCPGNFQSLPALIGLFYAV